MVSAESIEKQLKNIGFNYHGWGRTEVRELQNIILPEEEIYEGVNGFYEGGFALLLATDVRVLLVDKKPLNYLTVEDLRFDMINELDYSHRLIGAHISVSAGNKNLKFTSLNQPRLRRLIGHVQRCMAEAKKKQSTHQEGQHQHLEKLNEQLSSYLLAQYEHQNKLSEQLSSLRAGQKPDPDVHLPTEPLRPSPEVADYLLAQSLLAQHNAQKAEEAGVQPQAQVPQSAIEPAPKVGPPSKDEMAELYAEGLQEVFGKQAQSNPISDDGAAPPVVKTDVLLEINPLRVAYGKLPMALRNRKFGRPLFHAHSQEAVSVPAAPAAEA